MYRALYYGNLAAFRMLDTRQHRVRHAGKTILGEDQERWLLSGLASSPARWNVLAQQVFFATRYTVSASGKLINVGHWDDYSASRERILQVMAQTDVQNPVGLTGDVHANWANNVRRSFRDPKSEIVAAEFVGTSITSGGDGSDVRSDTALIRSRNPHIRFFNGQRGYVRCRVNRATWRADYRVLPYVSRAGAPISTRASFVVEAGRPGVQHAAGGRVSARTITSLEVEGDRERAQELADRASQ